MGLFDGKASGEIDLDWLPDDIIDRIVRRVEEQRLLGAGTPQRFRVVRSGREPAPETTEPTAQQAYRDPPRARTRSLHIVHEGGRSMFEDLELTFDGGHVHYRIAFPRARRVGLVMGAFIGGVIALAGASVASLDPGFGGGFMAFGVAIFVLFNWVAKTTVKQQGHAALAKLLGEEVLDARNEARLRVELGGGAALERAKAVVAVLEARGVPVTDADRARILSAADEATASRWLANAATATTMADVLARVRVGDAAATRGAPDEDADEEPPVSVAHAARKR